LTSPRPRQDRPVERIELRISIKADKDTAGRIRESIPSAVVRDGGCEVRVEAEEPAEMAEKARILLGKLKAVEGRS